MRFLIAGSHSGCGKTTVSLAVMAALRARGLNVRPFKAGPDYIDPGFHALACGQVSDNLDTHLCQESTVRAILARGEKSSDIAVIEGVMGYYDGMGATSLRCSTHELSRLTRTPTILVVDASGGTASVAAVVKGFQALTSESNIKAVFVNRVSSAAHFALVRDAIKRYTNLPCVGYLEKDARLSMPSRHLGLIPAEEQPHVREMIARAGEMAASTLNFELLLKIAKMAPALQEEHLRLPDLRGYRLGVARDEAFSFYYAENLRMLKSCGMEILPFSPLRDAALPKGISGLYIGGGFPEVFKDALADNLPMRQSVLDALAAGTACYAECGGLLYLCESIDGAKMTGFLPVECRMTEKLQHFGYVNILDDTGMSFSGHEFHRSVAEPLKPVSLAFRVCKASTPRKTWRCGYVKKNTLAGYAHLHFGSHPELIARLWL